MVRDTLGKTWNAATGRGWTEPDDGGEDAGPGLSAIFSDDESFWEPGSYLGPDEDESSDKFEDYDVFEAEEWHVTVVMGGVALAIIVSLLGVN